MVVYVRQVPASYVPSAAPRGRVREPSEFDHHVWPAYRAWRRDPKLAWFAVPYDGTDEKLDYLRRELDRAVQYINKGRLVRVGPDESGIPTMWYQVRDRQTRRPRTRTA